MQMAEQELPAEIQMSVEITENASEAVLQDVKGDGDTDSCKVPDDSGDKNAEENNESAQEPGTGVTEDTLPEENHEEEMGENENEEQAEGDRSGVDGGEADGINDEEMKDETGKDEDEDDEEEEDEDLSSRAPADPNVMPQVNVQVLASRKWQVKVYPLKPADFMSGSIWRVFKDAKESLLYLISGGKNSRGKGEMYISSVNATLRVVQGLMKRDSCFPEINVEIVKKNEEGAVEEKAYMRFDTKLVRMLFTPSNRSFSWGVHGRKRERIIGSVFVKNLPPSTSKDMLRVMFPFAQEINYNPEKFKEGTARLVLKSRTSVIPCLKAFAKVELGGQVLELHPLEKKRSSSSKSESRHRSRSASAEKSGDQEEKEKDEDTQKEGEKEEETASRETEKETIDKRQDSTKEKPERPNDPKERRKSEGSSRESAGKKSPFKKNEPNRSARGRREPDRSRKPRTDSRGFRARQGEGSRNRKFEGGRGGFRARTGRGGARGYGERSYNSGGSVSDVMNVEATKDMLVLQNQLSMAIKSQLAVLNQTKMAVEQAKIGASGLGLGVGGSGSSTALMGGSGLGQVSDVDRGYSPRGPGRDRSTGGGFRGQKRKAQQAGMRSNERNFGKRPFKGKAAQNRSGGGRGGASRATAAADYDDYRRREEEYRREMYARAEELRAADTAYGGLGSSYGSGGASAYGDYYGY